MTNPRRGLLSNGGGFIFGRLIRFSGWLRRGSRDLGFLRDRWVVTGRIRFFRFRGGVIYIIDISSPVGFGRSLIDSGPFAVNYKLVQDLLLPRNANGGNEPGWAPVHTKGTGPLFEEKESKNLGTCEAGALVRAHLIKTSGHNGLFGSVWPTYGRKGEDQD